MPFRAKKLRVQLPCSVEGSLVEHAEDPALEHRQRPFPLQADTYFCTCYLTDLDYCHCSVVLPPFPEGLVEPDVLPLLRKRLEDRLAEIDLVADVVKKRMEAQLEDIAVAEQALRDRQAEGQEPDESSDRH
jgi:hypothetical protein